VVDSTAVPLEEIEMTAKKDPAQKKAYKKPQVQTEADVVDSMMARQRSKDEFGLQEDLRAERDALAARVLELEKQSPDVRVAEFKAFIQDCLKTGGFNSSIATELLKR
jgi:hypothetical protein